MSSLLTWYLSDFERDGMLADSNLIGCLRNLMINEKPRYISSGVAYGDVNLDACPISWR